MTGHAAENGTFYTQMLGLRLIKKTVNQDDLSAYHFFYGDEIGHPGAELTFFDWPQAIPHRPGAGTVAALAWWGARFDTTGMPHEAITEWAGRRTLAFVDPEGPRLQLIDNGAAPGGAPWADSPYASG